MYSIEKPAMLTDTQRRWLLDLARRYIAHGLDAPAPLPVSLEGLAPELLRPAACFVTLERQGCLRGCIGTLTAVRPLAADVAHNAYAAAFADTRFRPVTQHELESLEIHISVLSEPTAMDVNSEAELIDQLRPEVDGLILQEGPRRATFLPSVWASLPEPRQFVQQLKLKGGWRKDYWSQGMQAYRYGTEQFG